jgi:2-oxoglutarate dehydrogenase E2 component (dihydrolipoamide succinyltransferase)
MATQVKVPEVGESIAEAVLTHWHKNDGAEVAADEPICELETDKATFDLPAPAAGVLHRIKAEGETVRIGETIAQIDPAVAPRPAEMPPQQQPGGAPAKGEQKAPPEPPAAPPPEEKPPEATPDPAAEKPSAVEVAVAPEAPTPQAAPPTAAEAPPSAAPTASAEGVRRIPMSKIRRRIAERLVRAQHTAAMLTTFNEIDMTAVRDVRARHQQRFTEAHGVPLGLVSFFAKACVLALRKFPALNAEIDGETIVYHDHVHLGLAVSTDRGLVVPVLRNVDRMSFARIEVEIKRVADAARDGKLSLEELSGGTFTITNGGVFGSLLSTSILNPPQTGILGMHVIQERPAAVAGTVQIRPMMYVALTYDHRLVDGREAVSFLVQLKQLLEDPAQMLLEI